MTLPCRHRVLPIFVAAPLLLLAAAASSAALAASSGGKGAGFGAQQAITGQSGPETSMPVFEMHSGFWVNLHHFLYLQARLAKAGPLATESGRGAAQPDEVTVSLLDFPEADIHAWQDAIAFYSKDLANRDLLLNGDMEIINNQLALMESCPDLEGKNIALMQIRSA